MSLNSPLNSTRHTSHTRTQRDGTHRGAAFTLSAGVTRSRLWNHVSILCSALGDLEVHRCALPMTLPCALSHVM